MTLYQQGKTIKVEFSTLPEVQKQLNFSTDENFYVAYSPETVKIEPCESKLLHLKTKINLLVVIEASIGLLRTYVARNLTIENFKRFTNNTKDEFITLDLLNRNFYNTVTTRKNQDFAFIILIGDREEDKIATSYAKL